MGQCLEHDQVDDVAAAVFAAAERADLPVAQVQKGGQPLLPLGQQLCPVHDHCGRGVVVGDQGAGHDGLAGAGRRDQGARRVLRHCLHGRLLGGGQLAGEVSGDWWGFRQVAGDGQSSMRRWQ